jgi:sugar phosphate isomerase/epimerase
MPFLELSGAIFPVFLSLTFTCETAKAAPSAGPEPRRFELGLATYTFREFTAFEAIDKIRECGGEVVEFHLWQKLSPEQREVELNADLPDLHIQSLRAKLKSAGLKAVNAYVPDSAFQAGPAAEAGVRRVFEFARQLGLRGLTGEPPKEQLDLVESMVKQYNIQWCFHNHPRDPKHLEYRNWEPAHVLSLLQKRDPRLGVSLDTGHLARSGVDPVEALKLLKGRVLSVHLKDVKEATPESIDVPLGKGLANIKGVLAELKRQNFRGHLAVEYEYLSERLMDDVKHSLNFVRAQEQLLSSQ